MLTYAYAHVNAYAAVFIVHVWITCFFGAVLWGVSCKILYQSGCMLCLGHRFYGPGIPICTHMLMGLHMHVCLWMRVQAVYFVPFQ